MLHDIVLYVLQFCMTLYCSVAMLYVLHVLHVCVAMLSVAVLHVLQCCSMHVLQCCSVASVAMLHVLHCYTVAVLYVLQSVAMLHVLQCCMCCNVECCMCCSSLVPRLLLPTLFGMGRSLGTRLVLHSVVLQVFNLLCCSVAVLQVLQCVEHC